MTSADVSRHDRGGVDQTPVDSGLPGTNAHAREMREVKVDLGVAALPLIGHWSVLHHGGAAAESGGRTRLPTPGRNRATKLSQKNAELTERVEDKV